MPRRSRNANKTITDTIQNRLQGYLELEREVYKKLLSKTKMNNK